MKKELDTEQIYHIIDLLEINIRDKKSSLKYATDKDIILKHINYDNTIIDVLKAKILSIKKDTL